MNYKNIKLSMLSLAAVALLAGCNGPRKSANKAEEKKTNAPAAAAAITDAKLVTPTDVFRYLESGKEFVASITGSNGSTLLNYKLSFKGNNINLKTTAGKNTTWFSGPYTNYVLSNAVNPVAVDLAGFTARLGAVAGVRALDDNFMNFLNGLSHEGTSFEDRVLNAMETRRGVIAGGAAAGQAAVANHYGVIGSRASARNITTDNPALVAAAGAAAAGALHGVAIAADVTAVANDVFAAGLNEAAQLLAELVADADFTLTANSVKLTGVSTYNFHFGNPSSSRINVSRALGLFNNATLTLNKAGTAIEAINGTIPVAGKVDFVEVH